MTSTVPTKDRYYTIEEYLKLEETALAKHEYQNGKLFEMPGGTEEHNAIAANCMRAVLNAIIQAQKPCRAMSSDQKVWMPAFGRFVYPDVTVLCEQSQYFNDRRDVILNPLLLFEVLSKSTAAYDRGKKFERYATLSSLREYVLVSQYEPKIESYFRENAEQKTWEYQMITGMDATVHLQSIDCSLALSDVYFSIDFEAIREQEQEDEEELSR